MLKTQDNHPAIAVKDACLARSGVYFYSYDEMVSRGYTPKVRKPVYSEYRPPEVITRCKDKFAFSAVTKEHTLSETSPENFHLQASGIVGDAIIAKTMDNGDVGLYGKMAFYTKDAWDYYQAGNKETSADYRSVCAPDPTGKYDFVLQDIISVNGVVITARGRGGPNVRVMDSANSLMFGGFPMAGKKGLLGFLGVGRTRDGSFALSKLVLDGVKNLHSLDAAGKEKLAGEMLAPIMELSEGTDRDLLIGAVKDCMADPTGTIKNEAKVGEAIDLVYKRAIDSETKAAEEILKGMTKDSDDEKKKKEEEEAAAKKAEGDKKTTDAAPLDMDKLIDAAADKLAARVGDSIGAIIDKKVQEALGVKPEPSSAPKTQDAGGIPEIDRSEAAFLLEGCFGA